MQNQDDFKGHSERPTVLDHAIENEVLTKATFIFDRIVPMVGRNDGTGLALRILALACEDDRENTPEGGLDMSETELVERINLAVRQQKEAKLEINQPAATV